MDSLSVIGSARVGGHSGRLVRYAILLGILLYLTSGFARAEYWVYTVRPGDNLWRLSEDYLLSVTYWKRIKDLNNVEEPREIPPGTRLRFPIKWLKTQPASATATHVRGEAEWLRAGESATSPLQSGTALRIGDRVRTGDGGVVTLEFADGSRLLVQPGSELIMDTLSAYGKTGMVDTRLRLNQGRTESETRPSEGAGSRYEIITPSAVAAVRGTSFRVGADSKTSLVEVEGGELGVAAQGVERAVPPGFGVVTAKGKPPQKPRPLLDPPDLSSLPAVSERPLIFFAWPPVKGAASYRAQVFADPALTELMQDKAVTKSEFQSSGLADGDYILRVRAVDSDGLEGRNATHTFTLNAEPIPPALLKPVEGAALARGVNPEFSWAVPTGVSEFRLQLARDSDFNEIVFTREAYTRSRITPDTELAPGDYYWRLASTGVDGEQGPYGDFRRLRVQAVPPRPESKPAEVDEAGLRIAWFPVADAVRYEFQLARDAEFEDLVLETEASETSVTIPEPTGTYHYRIRGVSEEGVPGPYSQTSRIDIPADWSWQYLLLVLPLIPLLL